MIFIPALAAMNVISTEFSAGLRLPRGAQGSASNGSVDIIHPLKICHVGQITFDQPR
jgi:hypothetical protein